MNDDKGWISLHRKFREHPLWEASYPKSKAEAWIDILLMARHKPEPEKKILGNEVVEYRRGEFITSQKKLMKQWGWSKSKLVAFLKLLQEEQMLNVSTDSKKTRLSVINYDTYQRNETGFKEEDASVRKTFAQRSDNVRAGTQKKTGLNPSNNDTYDYKETAFRPRSDRKPTAFRPQSDTNNNGNNANNGNKRETRALSNSAKSLSEQNGVAQHLPAARDVSVHLLQSIIAWDGHHKYAVNPPNVESWAQDIAKAIQQDGREKQKLISIIDELFTRQSETALFWAPKVKTGAKLREHYDSIRHDAQKEKHKADQKTAAELGLNPQGPTRTIKTKVHE